jgi:hypothetical protein
LAEFYQAVFANQFSRITAAESRFPLSDFLSSFGTLTFALVRVFAGART